PTAAPVGRVATPVAEDDVYPVGGYSSLSNRGSLESLLHSQLAYMEPRGADRPDLFDVKFVRDELLYYARDDNEFHRPRRALVVVVAGDCATLRFKDRSAPYQRGVLLTAAAVALTTSLVEWLEATAFAVDVFFDDQAPADVAGSLDAEAESFGLLLDELVGRGVARLHRAGRSAAVAEAERRATAGRVQFWTLAAARPTAAERALAAGRPWESAWLTADGPTPTLFLANDPAAGSFDDGDVTTAWGRAVQRLAEAWM
ncbi:MAG: hypothetical protein ACRDD1_10915, partial [Planctomycetia bacterium]